MSVDSKVAFTNTDGVAFPANTSINASGPAATDGTEFVKIMIDNYMFGPMQAVLSQTGQTPDGNIEIATASQMIEGIRRLVSKSVLFVDSGAANAYVLAKVSGLQASDALYDGMEIEFKATNSNTAASTVNPDSLGVTALTLSDGTALAGGEIVANQYFRARYNLSSTRFELTSPSQKASVKAWVVFDATGVILDSEGVTSVTRNALGDFTVNFTTAWATANYSATGFCRDDDDTSGDSRLSAKASDVKTVSAMQVRMTVGAGTAIDSPETSMHFTGRQ